MGKAIYRLASQYGFSVLVVIDNEEDWAEKLNDFANCDAAVEFSTPQTVLLNLTKCFELQIPVVSGTTGWYQQEELLKKWKNKPVSIVYGSNFSIGANLFFKLNRWLAQQMKEQPQYQVSIEEIHHVNKKDSPSGTALAIEQTILSQYDNRFDISIISHREGDVVGEHCVNYGSIEDSIQVKHCAYTRDAFAHGALKAALWLTNNTGCFAFEDIFDKLKK